MADLPEVQDYQSQVAAQEQRVSSLRAQIEEQNNRLQEEQSRFSQSIKATEFRRGTPSRPAVQKLQLMQGAFNRNRSSFESFQSEAQRNIEAGNAEVQSSFARAQAAQEAENQKQAALNARAQTGNISFGEFDQLYGDSFSGDVRSDVETLAYYDFLVSHGKELTSEQRLDNALSGQTVQRFRSDYAGPPKPNPVAKVLSTPAAPLIANGEAIIYQYTKGIGSSAKNVFVTTSGKEFVQGEESSGSQSTTGSASPLLSTKELLNLRNAVQTSALTGDVSKATLVSANKVTRFGNFVANQDFSRGVRSKYEGPIPLPNQYPVTKISSPDFIQGAANFVLTVPGLRELGETEIKVGSDIFGSAYKTTADVTRPVRQTTEFKNFLAFGRDVSEFSGTVGSNAFGAIAQTGQQIGPIIGPALYSIYGEKHYNALIEARNRTGFTGTPEQLKTLENQSRIVGYAAGTILPYAAGGTIGLVQRGADIVSAYRESPTRAAALVGTGIASSILFSEIGYLGKVVSGQLGGTIVGTTGFAKTFENVTHTGAKLAGVALLVPYGIQTLPPLVESFQRGDVAGFASNVATLQRTAASLNVGQQIGQRLATGFTLFRGTTYAKTFGGITSPLETIARKRFIANTFDAKYVEPDFTKSQQKTIESLTKKGGTIEEINSRGDIKISFEGEKEPVFLKQNPTAFEARQLYESKGVTKQGFLESYNTAFNKLPGASHPVSEIDYSKIEQISNNPEAQAALKKYFEANRKEFGIYGSLTQGSQLSGVDIRTSQDVDILAKNPEEFVRGAKLALQHAGVSSGKLDLFIGTEKSSLNFGGEKFLNVYNLSKDTDFFTNLEAVGGVLPRSAFTQTPSGINITDISFQAERKVVGGFVDLRAKDISDVGTITKGVEGFFSQGNSNSLFGSNIVKLQNFSSPDAKFGLTLLGQFETKTGIVIPGTKVRDVIKLGESSQPIQDISKLTNIEPSELVTKLGEIKVVGKSFSGGDIKEVGRFDLTFGTNPKPYITFTPGETKISIESDFAHELTHGGDYLANTPGFMDYLAGERLGPKETLSKYFKSPFEQRAYAVSGRFLELHGEQLNPVIGQMTGLSNPNNAVLQTLGSVSQEAINATPAGRFNLTFEGLLRTNLGIYSPDTKVSDILSIGKYSQPIQDISTITGISNQQLVSDIGNLPVARLSNPAPNQVGQFGDTIISGGPGIKIKALVGGPLKVESGLVHEITHAGQFFGGISEDTGSLRGLAYFENPAEQTAFNVQQHFLESKGFSLPAENLIYTNAADHSLIKKITSSLSSTGTSGGGKSRADIEKIFSNAYFTTPPAGIKNNELTLSLEQETGYESYNSTRSSNNYLPYVSPTKTSYPTFYPTKTPSAPYVAPIKYAPYVSPPSYKVPYFPVSKYDYVPPPQPNDYNPPYREKLPVTPPYSPPYTPPTSPPPLTTPPYKPPSIPPYTPPTKIVPRTPLLYFPTPVERPILPPREQKKNKRKKVFTGNGYDVFVLKNITGKKQFLQVNTKGTSLIQSDAIKFGENVVDRSLEASLFIKASKSPVGQLQGLPDISYKFNVSKNKFKKTIPVYVEQETYRLDTQTEVKKIHAAKIAAQLRKNIIKLGKPNRARQNFGFTM